MSLNINRTAIYSIPAGILAALLLSATARAQPFTDDKVVPGAEEEPKKIGKRPAVRTWAVIQTTGEDEDKYLFNFRFEPGIPNAKKMVEIMITANKIPKRPHPRFGSRVPMIGAKIVVELENPGSVVVGRYSSHAIPLTKGRYGLHMTPPQDGMHTMSVHVEHEDQTFDFEVKLPVEVWPLPEELQGTGAKEGKTGGRRRPLKL